MNRGRRRIQLKVPENILIKIMELIFINLKEDMPINIQKNTEYQLDWIRKESHPTTS